ncbi:hypothetical protein PSEUDO8AS_100021 [Pseudomonas sp. 8AS]|nr:hypothetical protein PSEUDO8AS_100021 [Pseudomonas sp. 8AS]
MTYGTGWAVRRDGYRQLDSLQVRTPVDPVMVAGSNVPHKGTAAGPRLRSNKNTWRFE